MPSRIRVEGRGLRVLRNIATTPPSLHREIERDYTQALLGEIKRLAPRDTGQSVREIHSVSVPAYTEIRMPISMIVMDQGRAPGARMPPPNALQFWLRRRQREGKLLGVTTYQLARSIHLKGITGRRFVAAALRRVRANRQASKSINTIVERRASRG